MTVARSPFSSLLELNADATSLLAAASGNYGFSDSPLINWRSHHNASITVTTNQDELNSDSNISLREAIQTANITPWDDIIVLSPGTYNLSLSGKNEDNNAAGDFDIQAGEQIAIVGLGQNNSEVVIDAKGLDRIFQILPGGALTLENVTLTGGQDDFGGAILNGGTLTVKDTMFSNNSALSGGAIYNFIGQIRSINDATFYNNSADYGGAIYSIFSTSPRDNTIGSIDNTTFLNNLADYGGAIFNYIGSTIGSISNSTFFYNSSQYYGEDIYNFLGTIGNLAQIYETNNFSNTSSNTIYPRRTYQNADLSTHRP